MCVCPRPLADSEKLPVRTHRPPELLKSPAADREVEAVPAEPKKKSVKEKKEKKRDKDRKVRAPGLQASTDAL